MFLAGVTAAFWLYETVAVADPTTTVALVGALLVTLVLFGPAGPSAVTRPLSRLSSPRKDTKPDHDPEPRTTAP